MYLFVGLEYGNGRDRKGGVELLATWRGQIAWSPLAALGESHETVKASHSLPKLQVAHPKQPRCCFHLMPQTVLRKARGQHEQLDLEVEASG